MIVLAETSKQKGGYMNSITNLLDLEDTDIEITDIQIQGQTKTLTLSTPPVSHFCPSCGFRMYSRGIKKRTINHPILQDNYSLVLILKQRRWRCTNPECLYDTSESFKFVNRQRRTTNATDMLIVDAYRNLLETSVSIAKKFHVSDSHAHDVFNRYVKLDRLTLTDPQDDPVYQFLDKKRAQGKPYYVYMTAGANKFLRIYYGRVKEYLSSLPES
jgi:transposase